MNHTPFDTDDIHHQSDDMLIAILYWFIQTTTAHGILPPEVKTLSYELREFFQDGSVCTVEKTGERWLPNKVREKIINALENLTN